MQLRPLARKGAAQEIVEQLREQILAGAIRPGEALPAERSLAETFGVNRLTVRQAIARLEALGLVRARHGSGTHVLDFRRTADVSLLSDLMTVRRADGSLSLAVLRDLLEVRRTLAVEVVALAASRATEDDLRDLRSLVTEQQARIADRPAFAAGDLAFTRRLVEACRNLALELLFNTVARFVEVHGDVAEAMYAEPAHLVVQYQAVLQLLQSRRVEESRAFVRTVLDAVDAQTLHRFQALQEKGRP